MLVSCLKMHPKGHESRVQCGVLVQRSDSGIFLVQTVNQWYVSSSFFSRYGARRRILESVATAHPILYVEKTRFYIYRTLFALLVFSRSQRANVLDLLILREAKKGNRSLKSRKKKKKKKNASSVFQEQINHLCRHNR